MSGRSGYSYDGDFDWRTIMWRGAVASAIRGKRGQAFLVELLAALDALPEKKLIAGDLVDEGNVCALGAVGKVRGLDMSELDARFGWDTVMTSFGITDALGREIMHENDSGGSYKETPEERFIRIRNWAASHVQKD